MSPLGSKTVGCPSQQLIICPHQVVLSGRCPLIRADASHATGLSTWIPRLRPS